MHPFRIFGLLVALLGCQEAPPLYPANAPVEIKEACALAQRKCTACHDRDRIVEANHSATEWRTTVNRMRGIPGSAISPGDGETILRCLTYNAAPPP